MRHIIIIFTNALLKKKRSTPSACVLVFLLVLVFRASSSFENNAAIQEQLFERRRKKKKKKKRVLLFFFLVTRKKIPKGTPLSLWGKKMTTDRKYVRARGGGGLEHRFSFICVVVDVSRRGSAPTVSVLRVSFPRFFVFPRDAFLRGRESAIASESGCRQFSLSLSLFLSLTERALPKRRPNGFDD